MGISFYAQRIPWQFDPLNTNSGVLLTNDNLTMSNVTIGATNRTSIVNKSVTSGKWYWEVKIDAITATSDLMTIGICLPDADFTKDTRVGWNESWGWMGSGRLYHDGAYRSAAGGADGRHTVNDIVMIALDANVGKMWMGKNNTWIESGDPVNGTNPQWDDATMLDHPIYPCCDLRYNDDQLTARFSESHQSYAAPSGFLPIS